MNTATLSQESPSTSISTRAPHNMSSMLQNLGAEMNPSQLEAICATQGPSLVLAGAGSGKTRVLTYKIAHLIGQKDRHVHPAEILAVTFTNKAAKEMTARVEKILGPGESKGLWLGTFHSISGRILRREIYQYQAEPGKQWTGQFVIYDDADSIALVKEAIKQLNLDDKLYIPKNVRYQISNLKNQLLTPAEFAKQATDYRKEKLATIYEAYEQLLSRNNALDFDDLLLKTVRLFQNYPEVLQKYHNQFKHVLVDEFQDTNDSQYELIRLLVEGCTLEQRINMNINTHWQNRSFTVVGDVDQSIYSWRGANFKIILHFQNDYPNSQLIKLEENYRSTGHILELANSVIENNSERLPKTLIAVRGEGQKPQCYEAQDDRDEAHFIIQQFQKAIKEQGLKPADCCILYRTNAQSRALEDVLMSLGLPYTVVGGVKFYERREIKDILAYLTVVFNEQDNFSLKRIINVPRRGIGNTTIQKLEAYANQHQVPLYSVLSDLDSFAEINGKTKTTLKNFMTLIQNLKAQVANNMPLDEVAIEILEKTGYIEALRQDDPNDEEGRIQNLEEFVTVTKQYLLDNTDESEVDHSDHLAGFLTQMALLSDIDTAESKDNMFVLMTLHAAKGLEYKMVALSGLEEGLFPHSRAQHDKTQLEEERRLLYVGITRAEDKLLMTYARKRMVFGELRYSMPSRFLKEMPPHLLSGLYTLDQGLDNYKDDEPYAYQRKSSSPQPRQKSTYDFPSDWGVQTPRPNLAKPIKYQSKPAVAEESVNLLSKGARVRHEKFGEGVVDQVIGSGNKAVYSIQFDTIQGKKLLDPKSAKLQEA